MASGIQIPIHSSVANALNYMLFDLVFAISIHILTSDIAGLTNYSTVIRFDEDAIGARKAPFVGTGITCTKRNVFYIVASIRFASWMLIFATTFLLRGISSPLIVKETSNVVSKGTASPFFGSENLVQFRTRRLGCQGRTETTYYYGEIRDGKCELDTDLLSKPVPHFSLRYQNTTVSIRSCVLEKYDFTVYNCSGNAGSPDILVACHEFESTQSVDKCAVFKKMPLVDCSKTSNTTISCLSPPSVGTSKSSIRQSLQYSNCTQGKPFKKANMRCENAAVACYGKTVSNCDGTVLLNGEIFICLDMKPKNITNEKLLCKKAGGFDWKMGNDIFLYGTLAASTIEDIIATSYGAGLERKVVRMKDPEKLQHATRINPLWFVILSIKVLAVASLLAVCVRLRFFEGFCPVASDEQGMKRLLQAETSGPSNRVETGDGGEAQDDQVYVTLVNHELHLITGHEE